MKKIFLISLAIILFSSSCKKSLLDVENPGAYNYNTYFTSADQINEAVIATYAVFLHPGMYSREYYFIFDLLGNDAKKAPPLQTDISPLADYTFTPSNSILNILWASLYRLVLRSNVVIDRASALGSAATDPLLKQYIAEARFMRAYAYSQLVTLWGKVPLRKSYKETLNDLYPHRAAVADVWAFVEADLLAAIPDLPVQYSDDDLGRAAKGAAIALLGKVFLYQKKWASARTTLLPLTTPAYPYSLSLIYDDLFSRTNQSNPEIIFQIMHKEWNDQDISDQYYMFGGQETWGGRATHSGRAQEYGFNDWGNVYISDELVKIFKYPDESNVIRTDPRAKSVMYGNAASGAKPDYCSNCNGGTIAYDISNGQRWRKYEYYEDVESYGDPQSGINSLVIRYADVLLMIAETYIQEGTPAPALQYIDNVRQRSGAFLYTTLGSQAQAMQILMRERRIELAGEQSRYFDLVRWSTSNSNILKQTLNTELQAQYGVSPVLDKHLLLPIPQQEKDTNPNVAGEVQGGWN